MKRLLQFFLHYLKVSAFSRPQLHPTSARPTPLPHNHQPLILPPQLPHLSLPLLLHTLQLRLLPPLLPHNHQPPLPPLNISPLRTLPLPLPLYSSPLPHPPLPLPLQSSPLPPPPLPVPLNISLLPFQLHSPSLLTLRTFLHRRMSPHYLWWWTLQLHNYLLSHLSWSAPHTLRC